MGAVVGAETGVVGTVVAAVVGGAALVVAAGAVVDWLLQPTIKATHNNRIVIKTITFLMVFLLFFQS